MQYKLFIFFIKHYNFKVILIENCVKSTLIYDMLYENMCNIYL